MIRIGGQSRVENIRILELPTGPKNACNFSQEKTIISQVSVAQHQNCRK